MAKCYCYFALIVAQSCHVYRIGPQPKLAARDPAARELSRRRQDQEAHHRQPVRLADRDRRRAAHPAEGRQGGAGRSGKHRRAPRVAHAHVAAVLGPLRNIGLDRMLGPPRNRCRDLVIAMIVARLIAAASKLATARMLDPLTASSSLGEVLGLGPVDEDELYVALDWLGERQEAIEKALARKHLHDGTLVLYDVSSSYVEGRCCELARLGYNRDGKRGKLQIVYGLLCAADGCPVAIEVFEGDTGDPRTLAAQIDKVKKRFALERVALVGDRGMITQARLDAEIAPAGLDWVPALRAPAIRTLVEAGALQMSLFDQRDMAAITSPDYPGERLIVCRNPDLARERTRKREDLLAATEADLAVIAAAVPRARNPLRGEAEIALKVGAVVNRHKVAKHFELSIGEASFSFHRKTEAIAAETALDGIYVVRTNLPRKLLDDAATVGAYKSLARVGGAFRALKNLDTHLRPIFHWTTPRVRAHVLLCMLAYHVEHHMRARLAPMLYDETDHEQAAAMRPSIVAKAERSEAARRKQTTGLTEDGLPVHSLQSLLADLATYARIQATTALNDKYVFTLHTRPTPIQQRAFELLAVNPDRTQ